jgi:hypothetical protein
MGNRSGGGFLAVGGDGGITLVAGMREKLDVPK